jgi:hypothetical protein
LQTLAEPEKLLLPKDRCDSCGSQAYVCVTGLNGELMFCNHHYNKIMLSPKGQERIESFAVNIVDERDFFAEDPFRNNDE